MREHSLWLAGSLDPSLERKHSLRLAGSLDPSLERKHLLRLAGFLDPSLKENAVFGWLVSSQKISRKAEEGEACERKKREIKRTLAPVGWFHRPFPRQKTLAPAGTFLRPFPRQKQQQQQKTKTKKTRSGWLVP